MSIDLVVPNPISSGMQNVQDQNNSTSALNISLNGVLVKGQDVVGAALPLVVQGMPVGSGQQTWFRLLRFVGTGSGQFFDIGIDQSGNLFLNGPSSTATNHIITISPSGSITIP